MKAPIRLLLALLLLAMQPCHAELTALQAESAYVFNFIKFVEWPANAAQSGDKLKLCVIGNDELHASLTALDGRRVGSRSLQVLLSQAGNDSLRDCQVLYIGAEERRRLVPILKSLGDAPVLTISDIADFAERGGNIGLLYRDNRMLFEINLASARRVGLRVSSQMLNLAANVYGR